MFRPLYYNLRFRAYLKNEHGIKKFAERYMGHLIRKVTKKSSNYREMTENMLVEKANLRLRAEELRAQDMLDAGEFFSVKRRLLTNRFITVSFVVAAVFLNFVSVEAFLGGETALLDVLRWVTAAAAAVVLTGGGLTLTERLIESVLNEHTGKARPVRASGLGVAVLWGALLVGLELSIFWFSGARAAQFATAQAAPSFYLGYVMLALLLPVGAGAVRWDAMRYIDVYKTTQTLREIEGRLAQIDSMLRQNEEFESNFYKLGSISAWDAVNEFKTYKDNYNQRAGITEAIGGHFSQTYDAFQAEANKRYDVDIRDATSRSMRKLEQIERAAGRTLGPHGGDMAKGPLPVSAHANGNGAAEKESVRNGTAENADVYLEPLPVR